MMSIITLSASLIIYINKIHLHSKSEDDDVAQIFEEMVEDNIYKIYREFNLKGHDLHR